MGYYRNHGRKSAAARLGNPILRTLRPTEYNPAHVPPQEIHLSSRVPRKGGGATGWIRRPSRARFRIGFANRSVPVATIARTTAAKEAFYIT